MLVGNTAVIAVSVVVDGNATDATAIGLLVVAPSGARAVYQASIEHGLQGQYAQDVVLTEPGIWRYRWAVVVPRRGAQVPGRQEGLIVATAPAVD